MAYYDVLIVGCGMYGSVFARLAADIGLRVLVIDRREHIGGNCFTEYKLGVHVHRYGPHIFHTNNSTIWHFVNRFSSFHSYVHIVKVSYQGRILSFPINLMTLHQLWGVSTPTEAVARLVAIRSIAQGDSAGEWVRSQVGSELYEIFFRGYTRKQWGRDPDELPASIVKRIPIRLTFDDRYFTDEFQGIPQNGYTALFQRMLDSPLIDVQLGQDYIREPKRFDSRANRTIFTGQVDELYGYCYGPLGYRSLRFEESIVEEDYQGIAVMNYTDVNTPFTRVVEHRHFYPPCSSSHSVITKEYPHEYAPGRDAYYPIRDQENINRHEQYRQRANADGIWLGGRLARYQYYDMHHVIAQAMADFDRLYRRCK